MSRFEVDSARLADASVTVRATVTAITSDVERMMHQLDELQGAWQGQAASGFAALAQEWRATQRHVGDSLESIERALSEAGRTYAETEAATARLFGR